MRRYFITFIDGHTRKTWVYFLYKKSFALNTFEKFKNVVKNESGEKIGCLRTDRGGEYNSSEFDKFCNDNGIKRQLTTSYTPQQNGVVERKNRTIVNMVRSMMSKKEVPKEFFLEAINWVVYVHDRSPTIALKYITLEEAQSDIKPSIKYFRTFGCLAYVHIPDQHRKKLDNKINYFSLFFSNPLFPKPSPSLPSPPLQRVKQTQGSV